MRTKTHKRNIKPFSPLGMILSTEITGKVIQMKILDGDNNNKVLATASGSFDDPNCAKKVEKFLLDYSVPVSKSVQTLNWIKKIVKDEKRKKT